MQNTIAYDFVFFSILLTAV